MHDSWTCLMVERGPGTISDEVRTELKILACDLYGRSSNQIQFCNKVVSGSIKTKGTSHLVGTRSGILFRALINCEDGTDYQVNFLISKDDLERGARILRELNERGEREWKNGMGKLSVPELYLFHDLSGPSQSFH